MLVTLFGMLILVSELQKENASFPMLVTLSGMLMQLRDSETVFANHCVPICFD